MNATAREEREVETARKIKPFDIVGIDIFDREVMPFSLLEKADADSIGSINGQGTLVVMENHKKGYLSDLDYALLVVVDGHQPFVYVPDADEAFWNYYFKYSMGAISEKNPFLNSGWESDGYGLFQLNHGVITIGKLPLPNVVKYKPEVVKPILERWRVQHPNITNLIVE